MTIDDSKKFVFYLAKINRLNKQYKLCTIKRNNLIRLSEIYISIDTLINEIHELPLDVQVALCVKLAELSKITDSSTNIFTRLYNNIKPEIKLLAEVVDIV